jgi:hypothetical protein
MLSTRRRHPLGRGLAAVLLALSSMSGGCAAPQHNTLALTIVPPISELMVLPHQPVTHGWQSDQIHIVACRGEFEPASFVITPEQDLPRLHLVASELIADDGDLVIPAEAVDIKYVKCWYQGSGVWDSIDDDGITRVLAPEMLLNDDQFVTVDYEAQQNYVRDFTTDDPDDYRCISNADDAQQRDSGHRDTYMPSETNPIRDSKMLQPTSLAAGENKQIWITIHVPGDAQPGHYTGKVTIRDGEKTLETLTLKLRVLPFDLLPPYYEVSLFHRPPYGGNNNARYRAELQNMINHGAPNPLMYSASDEEHHRIRQELGTNHGPFLGIFGDKGSPEAARKSAQWIKDFGYTDVYFWSADEAGGERLLAQIPGWKNAHEGGAKNMATGGRYNYFDLVGQYIDLFICSGRPTAEEAAKWHSVGHKIVSYAYPFAGVGNPELFRRGYGLVHWRANYDGIGHYVYYQAGGDVYNDFDERECSMVQPTIDGVIDTLPWEGFREAVDDVRYVTTLEKAIEQARASDDRARREIAGDAQQFLDTVDVDNRNLDTLRLEIINCLLKLQEAAQ